MGAASATARMLREHGNGGHVVGTQAISAESAALAEAFSRELYVKTDLLAAAEGEIELSAYREDGKFGGIVLTTSTSSARCEPRFSTVQIRRLAMDVRAKVAARASAINESTRQVSVTIYPRQKTFDIDVAVIYR